MFCPRSSNAASEAAENSIPVDSKPAASRGFVGIMGNLLEYRLIEVCLAGTNYLATVTISGKKR
jgi:hypothetical protein